MPTKGKKSRSERNWSLVAVASVVIILNVGLLVFTILNIEMLGWWTLLIAFGTFSSIWFSATAIKKNEPAWLLLDLILPN